MGEFEDGGFSGDGSFEEALLLAIGADAVGWVGAHGDGADGCLFEELEERFDPFKCQEGDLYFRESERRGVGLKNSVSA